MLHERMKAGKLGEDAQEMIGNGGAREIVDEPTKLGVKFHPFEKADHVRLGEVMGEEGTDDQVNRLVRLPGKDVGRDPVDSACWRSRFGGNGDGVGIKVDSSELNGDTTSASPALDPAESVAVAAADVDDVERRRGPER